MRLQHGLKAAWRLPNGTLVELGPAQWRLLNAVLEQGSLKLAAAAMGLSYRTAWSESQALNNLLGQPLIESTPGTGAQLTAFGWQLKWMLEQAKARLQGDLQRLDDQLNAEWMHRNADLPWLQLALCEDPVLQNVLAHPQLRAQVHLSVHWQGGVSALSAFHRQESRVAGCHLPLGPGLDPEVLKTIRRWLRGDQLWALPLFDRHLGWMHRPHHPCNVVDVCAGQARMVCLPAASITQHVLQSLCRPVGLESAHMASFQQEQNHVAMAAALGAEQADLGFGFQHAATLHGLSFLPLCADRYFLLFRQSEFGHPAVQALMDFVQSPAFEEAWNHHPHCRVLPREALPLDSFLFGLM